ncbi:hypothetical protein AWB78_08023 [Caballeronia calidae]|uniref:Uncharacterized protein n=1 Tax=Caballeronia calidae TaxID=1777139 RepID=A0A158EHI5_9BURK|nr:hypothetical protein [Caballeronia calidae]SAL06349.1 hypothetical protein AWB78_08023 [Caballeronia calidae]
MRPIPLRSTEPVKRIAIEEVRPLLPEDWGHGRILDVTAALFGYDNWTPLHQSPQASAPSIVFDQDMSYAEYSTRRVEVAKHVESRCAIPFPYAFALATIAAVTRDFRRKAVATHAPEHAVFQEEMATRDVTEIAPFDEFRHFRCIQVRLMLLYCGRW